MIASIQMLSGQDNNTQDEKLIKSDTEWKQILTPQQ